MDLAAEGLLASIGSQDRSAFEIAASRLLAALARGQELPPVPDPEAQRHFAVGLARLKDGAETLARAVDVVEGLEAIREIDASNAELCKC